MIIRGWAPLLDAMPLPQPLWLTKVASPPSAAWRGDPEAGLARSGWMPHRKSELPSKICVVCGKPFAWRKKWARDWERVLYCSERCRRAAPATRPPPG